MKQFLKFFTISSFLMITLSLMPYTSYAQLGDPGEDPDAPIDGGLGFLVAAGVGYGIKKYRDGKLNASKD